MAMILWFQVDWQAERCPLALPCLGVSSIAHSCGPFHDALAAVLVSYVNALRHWILRGGVKTACSVSSRSVQSHGREEANTSMTTDAWSLFTIRVRNNIYYQGSTSDVGGQRRSCWKWLRWVGKGVERESSERKAPKEEIMHEKASGHDGSLEKPRQGGHWGAEIMVKRSGRWSWNGGRA